MAVSLKPGNFPNDDTSDVSGFVGSMAEEMENALNQLLITDHLPELKMDLDAEEVRARRRLFIAIARGVVKHLVDNRDAIDIRRVDNSIVHPKPSASCDRHAGRLRVSRFPLRSRQPRAERGD